MIQAWGHFSSNSCSLYFTKATCPPKIGCKEDNKVKNRSLTADNRDTALKHVALSRGPLNKIGFE